MAQLTRYERFLDRARELTEIFNRELDSLEKSCSKCDTLTPLSICDLTRGYCVDCASEIYFGKVHTDPDSEVSLGGGGNPDWYKNSFDNTVKTVEDSKE